MIDKLMWFIGAPVVTQWLRFPHIRSLSLRVTFTHNPIAFHIINNRPLHKETLHPSITHRLYSSVWSDYPLWIYSLVLEHHSRRANNCGPHIRSTEPETQPPFRTFSLVFISQLFGHITNQNAGNPRIVVQPINVMIHQFLYSNRMAIHTSGSECLPSSLVFHFWIRSVLKQLPNSILIGLLVCQNVDHLLTPYRWIRRLAPCWICTEPTTRKVIMLDTILRGSRRRPLFGSLSVIYALVGRDSAQNTIPGGSQRARFLKITH